MPTEPRLIPTYLVSLYSFRKDLTRFLSLAPDQLLTLSRMAGESERGFSPSGIGPAFGEAAGIKSDEAQRMVLVADYLYERCRSQHITSDAAIEELTGMAPSLGIQDIQEKAAALSDLLSVKEAYEAEGYARRQATGVAGHFMGLTGVWDIRPVFHRETREIAKKLSVLLVSVSWHDEDGTSHSVAFQLDQGDWARLKEKVDELEEQRVEVSAYLEHL